MKVRRATAADAAAIASIYAPYVLDSAVSFETDPPDTAEMRARIEAGGDLYPFLVACEEERPLGFASASAFRSRPAYRFTVETSVYVAERAYRRGIGTSLYRPLLATLAAQGFVQAIAAISLPNEASVAMHEALGFTRAGVYEKVGFKRGQWLSVGLWQRALASMSAHPAEPRPLSAIAAV